MVRIRFIVVLALALILCGMAQVQNPPTPTSGVTTPEKVESPRTMPTAANGDTPGLPVDPKSYEIGPEDVLYIRVWREPDFTEAVGVRPDGKVTMNLIHDVQAAGLTPERLAAQLTEILSEYINKPEVTVSVVQVNSKKYTITGEVNRPGVFPLVVPTRVFDALGNAGGFKEFANKKDIVIVRGDKRLHFNWNDYVHAKKLEQNVFVENGDTLLVK